MAGFIAYERFSADLPSVAGLRHYQPPVMSRVYAGNGQLMAELATERRIFVPSAAIPDLVKQALPCRRKTRTSSSMAASIHWRSCGRR